MKPGRSPGQRSTRRFTKGLSRAVRRESWGRTVLQLAWTAGPVTYLALQGGYYIAYQEPAPPAVFFYFGGYTVVAGLTALLVRIFYQATRGEKKAEEERRLGACLAELPRLLLRARDHALMGYGPDDAALIGAKHLLQNPDATELAVAVAIRDLGGSRDLAYAFQRMEVFRRNGMRTSALAERDRMSDAINSLVNEVRSRSVETAALVEARANCDPPDKSIGSARLDGFIERALAADSKDDTSFLTIADAEEILRLVIELLAGRIFPLVVFHFDGESRLKEAWNNLERARREYRTKLRSRDSRLRRLAEILSSRMPDYIPANSRLPDVPKLLRNITAALEKWNRELSGPRLRRPSAPEFERFRQAVTAYRQLAEADKILQRTHQRLLVAAHGYEAAVAERKEAVVRSKTGDRAVRSIRAEQKEIELTEPQKRAVAESVWRMLPGIDEEDPPATPSSSKVRHLAVDLISELEKYIPLYRTEVQQAIELSRAPIFTSLEPGLSRKVRIDWVLALVAEVEEDQTYYLEKRLAQLVQYHALILNEVNKQRLAETLGIDLNRIPAGIGGAEPEEAPWAAKPTAVPPLPAKILERVVPTTHRSRPRQA